MTVIKQNRKFIPMTDVIREMIVKSTGEGERQSIISILLVGISLENNDLRVKEQTEKKVKKVNKFRECNKNELTLK